MPALSVLADILVAQSGFYPCITTGFTYHTCGANCHMNRYATSTGTPPVLDFAHAPEAAVEFR
jgi:hypothetical protein